MSYNLGVTSSLHHSNFAYVSPPVPKQENGCDCGVFVCRYAYGLYLMRHQLFTPKDINDNFKGMITNGSAFDFDMKDIARIREEFATLIDRLSPKYLAIKDAEEKAAKRAKKNAPSNSEF